MSDITETPVKSTTKKSTTLSIDCAWIVSQTYLGKTKVVGCFLSEEAMTKKFPSLVQSEESYFDCDINGNGLSAIKMTVDQ